VAAVRSCQKLLLCPIEPMPAGSKRDPPLAKAEPIGSEVEPRTKGGVGGRCFKI